MSDRQRTIRDARRDLDSALRGAPVTRAGFLAGAGVGMAAFLAACGSSSSTSSSGAATSAGVPTSGPTDVTYVKGGQLNVYSWPEYFAPDNTKEWKAKTGAKLNIASYESNDELFAKLSTAAGRNYDIVIPTSSFVSAMVEADMLEPIDRERVPWQNVERTFLGKVFDPSNAHSVPKDFGTAGVLYDPELVGGKIVTWQDFADAAARPGVSGKVRWSDDAQGGLGPGLWTLGFNYDSSDVAQWSKAADWVKAVIPHVKTIGDTFNTDPIVSGQLAMTMSDSSVARRAILQNSKLRYVLPKPHSELWVDNYCIVKGSQNPDAAYSFMQFMMQGPTQVRETKDIGYAYPLPGLEGQLKSFPQAQVVFPTEAQFDYLQSSVIHPKVQGDIQDLWAKVKASAA